MISLKKLKMKKVKNLLSTKEDVVKVYNSLEQKTAKAFAEFSKAKRKSWEISNMIFLD